MKRANVLQEVRQRRIEKLYAWREQRTVTMAEAAEILGVTERTFRRWEVLRRRGGAGSAARTPIEAVPSQDTVRFMVRATEPGTVFIPRVGTNLADILCVQNEQVVAKDYTVHDHRQCLQIVQDPQWFHDVTVTVPEGLLYDLFNCFDNRPRSDAKVVDEFVRLPAMWDRANCKLMHLNAFWSDRAEHCISETAVRIVIFNREDAPLCGPGTIQQRDAIYGDNAIEVNDPH